MELSESYEMKKSSKTQVPELTIGDGEEKRKILTEGRAFTDQIDEAVQIDYDKYEKTKVRKRVTRYVRKRD